MVGVAPGLRRSGVAMDPRGREVGRSGEDGVAIHDDVLAVHQPAALAAIGGVIEQRHPRPMKDRDGILLLALVCRELAVAVPVCEGHQLPFALALMGCESRIMLPAPGLAVEVLEHHLHLDAAPVLLRQGLGDSGQGELLNRHQNFGLEQRRWPPGSGLRGCPPPSIGR